MHSPHASLIHTHHTFMRKWVCLFFVFFLSKYYFLLICFLILALRSHLGYGYVASEICHHHREFSNLSETISCQLHHRHSVDIYWPWRWNLSLAQTSHSIFMDLANHTKASRTHTNLFFCADKIKLRYSSSFTDNFARKVIASGVIAYQLCAFVQRAK